MQQVACGVLLWRPAEFWSATMPEFQDAVEGWREANTQRRDADEEEWLDWYRQEYGDEPP